MVPYIETVIGRDGPHAGIQTPDQYLEAHRRFIQQKARAGKRVRVHESPVVRAARIHANQWVIDCECGAGNAVDPRWGGLACCFGCGAIHRAVTFPSDWDAIERTLVQRTEVALRHWLPGESLADLREETDVLADAARKGVPARQAIIAHLETKLKARTSALPRLGAATKEEAGRGL